MKYAVKMKSGGKVYIPTSLKIGSGVPNITGGGGGTHTDTHRKGIS